MASSVGGHLNALCAAYFVFLCFDVVLRICSALPALYLIRCLFLFADFEFVSSFTRAYGRSGSMLHPKNSLVNSERRKGRQGQKEKERERREMAEEGEQNKLKCLVL